MAKEKLDLEKEFQNKFDQLEKENEILTKDMLKHMKRSNELSQSLHEVIIIIAFVVNTKIFHFNEFL